MMQGAMQLRGALLSLCLSCLPVWPTWAATNPISAGKLVVEAPTLTAIGVEWKMTGDDNTNAVVTASYRRKGEQIWHPALPLLRLHHEVVNDFSPPFQSEDPTPENPRGERENPWHYDVGNMFSGSIMGLQPGTEYECRFVLSDPDG
ncbi:MAG TPA: hypothetical protein VGH23_15955, partial [Rhizomicrobium sp.]